LHIYLLKRFAYTLTGAVSISAGGKAQVYLRPTCPPACQGGSDIFLATTPGPINQQGVLEAGVYVINASTELTGWNESVDTSITLTLTPVVSP
jgi:hypothetical protein